MSRKLRTMRSVWIWLIVAVPAAWAVWQLQLPAPLVPAPVLGFSLLTLGLLVGLRIGADGMRRFTKDVIRMNKCLAEQNDDLAELNLQLLVRFREDDTGDEHSSAEERSE